MSQGVSSLSPKNARIAAVAAIVVALALGLSTNVASSLVPSDWVKEHSSQVWVVVAVLGALAVWLGWISWSAAADPPAPPTGTTTIIVDPGSTVTVGVGGPSRLPGRESGPELIRVGDRPQLAVAFVARSELVALREALGNGGTATVCALRGMRGVGKSQLASAFAEECEAAGWPLVAWIDAASRGQAVAGIANLARPLEVSVEDAPPEQEARRVVEFLNSHPSSDRLVVFDNVENLDDLKGLRPHSDAAQVVLTTTNNVAGIGAIVPVGVYSERQAVDYLLDRTGLDDRDGAVAVAVDLGFLPLAVAQAVTAMTTLGYGFSAYRDTLANSRLDQVTYREPGDAYPDNVGAALRLGLSAVTTALASTDAELGSCAVAVLGALSLLAEPGVPAEWLGVLAQEPVTTARVVGELVNASLVIRAVDGQTVSVHRLIGRVLREDAHAWSRSEAAAESAARVLAGVDPVAAQDFWTRRNTCQELASQLMAVQDQPHSRAVGGARQTLVAAGRCGYAANVLGDPYTTIRIAGYVDRTAQVLGPDHPDTLTSRNNLAYAYQSAGDLAKAIPLYQATLTDRERVLGPDHPDTLTSRNNLAYAYQSAGDLAKAIPLYQATLTDSERVLGPDHPITKVVKRNLEHAPGAAAKSPPEPDRGPDAADCPPEP